MLGIVLEKLKQSQVQSMILTHYFSGIALATEYGVDVITLDIDDPMGREAVTTYGFTSPMEFVLFNAAGDEIERLSMLPEPAIIMTLFD